MPIKTTGILSYEKVVIVTDIPAHRSVIGSEICGIYTKSSDPIDIANSIEYTYDNRNYLASWGSVGRRIVEEKYTWAKVAKDLEQYLLSMNSKRHKLGCLGSIFELQIAISRVYVLIKKY